MRSKELMICGLKAVRSRFETNSQSVKRLFFSRAIAPQVGDLCRWMASERMVYRCVEPEELERISGSIHHGGVVVVVDAPEYRQPNIDDVIEWSRRGETLLILDRIGNVHNLGAIIRSAAFFGVTKVLLPDHPDAAIPTEATWRVAEGALDSVEVLLIDHLPSFIRAIWPHYFVIGATSDGGRSLNDVRSQLPKALVMGNEETGLAPEVASVCNSLVTIQGSGSVESLNVSAAAAVLLFQFTRRQSPS